MYQLGRTYDGEDVYGAEMNREVCEVFRVYAGAKTAYQRYVRVEVVPRYEGGASEELRVSKSSI